MCSLYILPDECSEFSGGPGVETLHFYVQQYRLIPGQRVGPNICLCGEAKKKWPIIITDGIYVSIISWRPSTKSQFYRILNSGEKKRFHSHSQETLTDSEQVFLTWAFFAPSLCWCVLLWTADFIGNSFSADTSQSPLSRPQETWAFLPNHNFSKSCTALCWFFHYFELFIFIPCFFNNFWNPVCAYPLCAHFISILYPSLL